MTQTFEAIYENGVLRPLTPLTIDEHTKLRVSIEDGSQPHPLLKYCGTISKEDADEIQKIIQDEFEGVNPDDWK